MALQRFAIQCVAVGYARESQKMLGTKLRRAINLRGSRIRRGRKRRRTGYQATTRWPIRNGFQLESRPQIDSDRLRLRVGPD